LAISANIFSSVAAPAALLTQLDFGNALEKLGQRENNAARLHEAITCMQGAVEEYDKAGETYWLPQARRRLAAMKTELSRMR